jgi:type I restriction enzyme R subunit
MVSNFSFLAEHDPVFLQLTGMAERAFVADPNTTLIKLRQLGEALAREVAARAGIRLNGEVTQADLLSALQRGIGLDANIRGLFHTLRREGNKAAHEFHTRHREALDGLKAARELCLWFHRSFGKNARTFKPGPFLTPADPSQRLGDGGIAGGTGGIGGRMNEWVGLQVPPKGLDQALVHIEDTP